jgi:hypothetical protein
VTAPPPSFPPPPPRPRPCAAGVCAARGGATQNRRGISVTSYHDRSHDPSPPAPAPVPACMHACPRTSAMVGSGDGLREEEKPPAVPRGEAPPPPPPPSSCSASAARIMWCACAAAAGGGEPPQPCCCCCCCWPAPAASAAVSALAGSCRWSCPDSERMRSSRRGVLWRGEVSVGRSGLAVGRGGVGCQLGAAAHFEPLEVCRGRQLTIQPEPAWGAGRRSFREGWGMS